MTFLRINKRVFLYYLVAFIFVYGYCTTISLGSAKQSPISLQNAPSLASSKNILSYVFKPSYKMPPVVNSERVSSEIWHRMRSRLNLKPAHASTLMQHHVKSFAQHQDYINMVVRNATPYLYYILEEVERRGMPSEIALLPVIESDFNPHTLSSKGALGLWQLMPSLGRLHGLKQNAHYDGRKDVYESTKVALDHLDYLHKRFNGNWLLAIAAYNCGEYKILREIKKNKSAKKGTDFWSLKLSKETMHFVPKLLAFAAIIRSPQQYGVKLPIIADQPVIARVNTGKAIDIAHAAKLVDLSETQLRRLNPGIHKRARHPKGPYNLVVPVHQAALFKAHVDKVPPSAVTKLTQQVDGSATNLISIATKTATEASDSKIVTASKVKKSTNRKSGHKKKRKRKKRMAS